MFERFTDSARRVVVHAQEEARTFGHSWLGTEHLLLGALAETDTPAVRSLAELGVTLDRGRAALRRVVGEGGLDAEALRTLGIDLDQVRTHVEAAFGPGALDRPPAGAQRRGLGLRRRRRGRCEGAPGHLRFAGRAKRALERSLREAVALGDRHIGVEHVLLGLLDPKGNMAVELLRHLGAEPEAVRALVLRTLGKAA